MSQNPPSGLMRGKEGLGHELGALVAYRNEGKFALLHSVTNCIRIADLTVFDDDMPRLQEIKASAQRGSRYRAQKRRAERAIAVINDGGLLGDDEAELFPSKQQLKSMFGVLRDALTLSATDGHSSVVAGRQHVITTYNLSSARDDLAAFLADVETRKRRAFDRADLGTSEHHLNAPSLDIAGRSPALAPPTIFPLPPGEVAAITVDFIGYDVTVGWERLAGAFERRGFDVHPAPFPPEGGHLASGVPVMSLDKGDLQLNVHTQATGQLLLELLDVDRFADAVAEYASRPAAKLRAPSGVVTFHNERATWR